MRVVSPVLVAVRTMFQVQLQPMFSEVYVSRTAVEQVGQKQAPCVYLYTL